MAQLLRELQIQRRVELTNAERDGPLQLIPLPRNQLNGDFVIDALKEGYSFKETQQGLAIVKIEKYLALVFHPDAKCTREMHEVKEPQVVEVEWNLFRSTPHQVGFTDLEASDSVSPFSASHTRSPTRTEQVPFYANLVPLSSRPYGGLA